MWRLLFCNFFFLVLFLCFCIFTLQYFHYRVFTMRWVCGVSCVCVRCVWCLNAYIIQNDRFTVTMTVIFVPSTECEFNESLFYLQQTNICTEFFFSRILCIFFLYFLSFCFLSQSVLFPLFFLFAKLFTEFIVHIIKAFNSIHFYCMQTVHFQFENFFVRLFICSFNAMSTFFV